jgi:dUTP pyrophosphatase
MKVQVVNNSNNEFPKYATIGSSAVDLKASILQLDATPIGTGVDKIKNEIILLPGGRCIIPTDLFVAIPEGYEIQIRPRSGLAIKDGITCLNTPGTIDADYRGNIGIILINHSNKPFYIKDGDRIAQAVLCKVEKIEWETVLELPTTKRGEGGYGHTGK